MISDRVLLMSGTGAIGSLSARALRAVYPDVPLLIGGRDLLKSHKLTSLLFAQTRRVPHLNISSGVYEIAPEVATYTHSPSSAAIVLAMNGWPAPQPSPRLHAPNLLRCCTASRSVRLSMSRIKAVRLSPRILSD